MNQQKIGEFIKSKRKEKGLTQIELANKLGITNQAISKWERGKNCPDISLLKDLCKILDININELLSGKELEKVSKEDSEDILVETVKTYTNIEKKKRIKLWFLTISIIVIDIIFIIMMILIYNQVNDSNSITIDKIRGEQMVNKVLSLSEKKEYDKMANILDDTTYISNRCNKDIYDYICLLKELNELGVDIKRHKVLKSYFVDVGYREELELVVKYKNIEEKVIVYFTTQYGKITDVSFGFFKLTDDIICADIYNSLNYCHDLKKQYSIYLYELKIDKDNYFEEEVNKKIVNLFSSNNNEHH